MRPGKANGSGKGESAKANKQIADMKGKQIDRWMQLAAPARFLASPRLASAARVVLPAVDRRPAAKMDGASVAGGRFAGKKDSRKRLETYPLESRPERRAECNAFRRLRRCLCVFPCFAFENSRLPRLAPRDWRNFANFLPNFKTCELPLLRLLLFRTSFFALVRLRPSSV